jgi:hypothetical protein
MQVDELLTSKELIEKFEILERQKNHLFEEMKELRKKAEQKVLLLECEVAVLREDAETLRLMVGI